MGCPSRELVGATLERALNVGTFIIRSGLNGDIELRTEGAISPLSCGAVSAKDRQRPGRPKAGTDTDAHVPAAEPRTARSDWVQPGRRKGLRIPDVVDFKALQAL